MEFRTKLPKQSKEPKIGYDSKILLLGSCFVENIGSKLEFYKFRNLLNPFGILFHPAAIADFLEEVKNNRVFTEEEVFFHNERWHSFRAHSDLSSPSREALLKGLNAAVEKTRSFLQEASHVVITPGTAWGYRLRESGEIVANCHKLPQVNFNKELLEVREPLQKCVDLVRAINPTISVIFTVSPVRHLRDGFVNNQRSKASLISAVHEIIASGENLHYFPSYEIMMDELRDYRFYSEDMLHPGPVAVNYIWEQFTQSWMSSETLLISKKIEGVQKGLSHRPFNEQSRAHQQFVEKLDKEIEELQQEFSFMKF